MRKLLEQLFAGESLSEPQALAAMDAILDGNVEPVQVAALLSCYRMRAPSLAELLGFRESVLQRATKLDLEQGATLDMVGTGGDGMDTFNVTTASALTVAACGVKVVKHGNGSASSKRGSSDILRDAGFSFRQNKADLQRQLDAANITFLHAPLFHPALGKVAELRRALGIGTLFNLLGPLVNPAQPTHHYIGVADAASQGLYEGIFRGFAEAYNIVHSNDGYDEATLTGPVRCYTNKGRYTLQAKDFGLSPTSRDSITIAKDAKQQFLTIMQGKGSVAQTDTVAANAGMALQLALGHTKPLPEYCEQAKSCLRSGSVYANFKKLLAA